MRQCLDCEDLICRPLEEGGVPDEAALSAAKAFLERLGDAIHRVHTGIDIDDVPPSDATSVEAEQSDFESVIGTLPYSEVIRSQLTPTTLAVARDLGNRGWSVIEVRIDLDRVAALAERFQAWMVAARTALVTTAVELTPDGDAVAAYRFLMGLESPAETITETLGALDAFAASVGVSPIEVTRFAGGEAQALALPRRSAAAAAQADTARSRVSASLDDAELDAGPRDSGPRNEFLRIDGRKVSLIMDLAGELGLACGAVTHHPELEGLNLSGFSAAAHKLEMLVRELQNEVSAMRLVPVAGAFQKMKRVVRDTARRTGKLVELELVGEDTEIDKIMVDQLADPLVHMVRNAIDHGLESPEERVRAGKPEVGRITLEATHQGGEVSVRVIDDGKGLDLERILRRARERGLVGPDTALTEEQIMNLVFLPGFSTKETIDELSGRGVGMDVIKTTIEGLRGRVSIKSTFGRGSRITMTVPLTLAFVEAMVVSERDRLFALPIERVFEVFKADASRMARNTADGQTLMRVRDELVPVLWLHEFYGDDRPTSEQIAGRIVVVVQTSKGGLALPVDALLGNQQIMLKPLQGLLSGVRAAAGCGMLRSGDVALAVDCEQLHV